MRQTRHARRQAARRGGRPRPYLPLIESFEPRCLLSGGPLTITITEVQTGQTVTIVDNNTVASPTAGVDSNAGIGDVLYSSDPAHPAFRDFQVNSIEALSNRTAASAFGILSESGTITRTTNTAGAFTLRVSVADTGFTNPTSPLTLDSNTSGTFTNPTALDGVTYQSFANSTASPVIKLTPNLARNPDSESGTAPTTPFTGPSPYSLSSVYTITLGPSNTSTPSYVSFQNTGTSYVSGNTNTGTITGTVYLDKTGDGLTADDTPFPAGVTITLSGTTTGGTPIMLTTVSSPSNGTYSFTNLQPGTYTVSEGVPSGYVETGPALFTYTVTTGYGTISPNNNFDNFLRDDGNCVSNVSYLIDGSTRIYGLRGNTAEGEQVSVTFTADESELISFVSYTAPDSYFNAADASGQVVFDSASVMAQAGKTYTLTVQIPNTNYQIDFICGSALSQLGPAGSNIFYTPQGRLIDADNSGYECQLPVGSLGSLSGTVFLDANANGIDTEEAGIAGVTIRLTGTDDLNKPVSLARVTGPDGTYSFKGLRPGTYAITEVQPSGYVSTQTTIGTVGVKTDGQIAAPTANSITAIALGSGGPGLVGINYNFGELHTTGGVACNTTGTTDFWAGCYGQQLIGSFNGGSGSTALGNWLAADFPNLYGPGAGSNNLTGKTNAQVAGYFEAVDGSGSRWSPNAQAEVLATALSVYATTSSLGGGAAAPYGFAVSPTGLGTMTFNVGCDGSAFGLSNGSTSSVIQLLQAVNGSALNGVLYGGNQGKTGAAGDAFCNLNQAGKLWWC